MTIVALCIHLLEIKVHDKTVTGRFHIRLIAYKVMNRRSDRISGFFPGTDGMHRMPDHREDLKWNHHLVSSTKSPTNIKIFFALIVSSSYIRLLFI